MNATRGNEMQDKKGRICKVQLKQYRSMRHKGKWATERMGDGEKGEGEMGEMATGDRGDGDGGKIVIRTSGSLE